MAEEIERYRAQVNFRNKFENINQKLEEELEIFSPNFFSRNIPFYLQLAREADGDISCVLTCGSTSGVELNVEYALSLITPSKTIHSAEFSSIFKYLERKVLLSELFPGQKIIVNDAITVGVSLCVEEPQGMTVYNELLNEKVKEDDEPEAYIQFLFEEEVPETVLNEYVIKEISKYLGFKELSCLRRVNKLWSIGSMPAFIKKSVLSLASPLKSDEELAAFEKWTVIVKGVSALKLSSPLSGFGRDVEIFQNILAVLGPTLQTIKLQSFDDGLFYMRGAPISLPALTNINLFFCRFNVETWRILYAAAPSLRRLVVQPFNSTALFRPLLTDDGGRNWALAPSLNSLALSMGLLPVNANIPSNLLSLANFPQSWATLDMTLRVKGGRDMDALLRLLEKRKDSIVNLKLKLDDHELGFHILNQHDYELPPGLDLEGSFTLRLPATFSKLQSLELGFSQLQLYGHVTFGEHDAELIYSEMMPNLRLLSVQLPSSGDCVRGIWRSLFPPQVFQGLKHLKLVAKENGNQFFRDVEAVENWAAGIFPQATTQISLISCSDEDDFL